MSNDKEKNELVTWGDLKEAIDALSPAQLRATLKVYDPVYNTLLNGQLALNKKSVVLGEEIKVDDFWFNDPLIVLAYTREEAEALYGTAAGTTVTTKQEDSPKSEGNTTNSTTQSTVSSGIAGAGN